MTDAADNLQVLCSHFTDLMHGCIRCQRGFAPSQQRAGCACSHDLRRFLPYLTALLVFLLGGAFSASGNLLRPDAVADRYGAVWVPPASESFAYDADGNRQSSSLWNYRWDGRNMLVETDTRNYASASEHGRRLLGRADKCPAFAPHGVSEAGGRTNQRWHITFDYDSEGRRFRKNITHRTMNNGVPQMTQETVTFLWKGWDLVYERHTDPYGNFLYERKYVWGADLSGAPGSLGGAGGLLVMRETRGQTTTDYYPLYDGCGHVVALSDGNGNLVASYAYGPFGELISASGSMAATNPWCWATKYYDSETGLYYFGHRYYDPATGQWLNREPLGEDESLNLYAYCHNDPVNKTDALGMAQVATNGRGDLTAIGQMLAWVAKYDPSAAYKLLMVAQLERELGGAPSIDGLAGNGDADASANVLRAVGDVVGNAISDGRSEWRHVAANAGADLNFDAGVTRNDLVAAIYSHVTPLLKGRAAAAVALDTKQRSDARKMMALEDDPAHRMGEIGLEASYLIPRALVGGFNQFSLSRVTTGQEFTFNGWSRGVGLSEVPTSSRFMEAGLTLLPLLRVETGAVEELGTAANNASRLAPGGGLMAHEAEGGHLLAFHLGQSESQLASRLASNSRLSAASTFGTRAEAEAAISHAFDHNASTFSNWLSNGAQGRQVLNAPWSGGTVLQRGASSAVPGTGVRAVLQGNGSGGYYILTGFPTP